MAVRRARKTDAAPQKPGAPPTFASAGDPAAAIDPIPPADFDDLPSAVVDALAAMRSFEASPTEAEPDDDPEALEPRRVCLLCGDDVSHGTGSDGHEGGCAHAECARSLRRDAALESALARVAHAHQALAAAQRALHAALLLATTRGTAEREESVPAAASATTSPATNGTDAPPCPVCAARDAQLEALAARRSERRRRPMAQPAAQIALRFDAAPLVTAPPRADDDERAA